MPKEMTKENALASLGPSVTLRALKHDIIWALPGKRTGLLFQPHISDAAQGKIMKRAYFINQDYQALRF